MEGEDRSIREKLEAPFPAEHIRWKPQAFSRDRKRALMVAYTDARNVAERLDDVFGVDRWSVDYHAEGETLICSIEIPGPEGPIRKSDGGLVELEEGTNGEAKSGDRSKATKGTISDAFKRAGVVLGIGRYLYRLAGVWVEWDVEKKRPKEAEERKLAHALAAIAQAGEKKIRVAGPRGSSIEFPAEAVETSTKGDPIPSDIALTVELAKKSPGNITPTHFWALERELEKIRPGTSTAAKEIVETQRSLSWAEKLVLLVDVVYLRRPIPAAKIEEEVPF